MVTVRTKDHPEANGRKPQPGEVQYTFTFPLEGGESLLVRMGKESLNKFQEFLGSMAIDDAEETRG